MIARYRALLRLPGAFRLLASSIVGRLPLGMFPLAVLLLIHEQGGSVSAGGAAVGAYSLTNALTSPAKARALHCFGIRRVVVCCAGFQAVSLVGLVLVARGAQTAPILVFAAACGALTPPTSACARGLWPRVAPSMTSREAAYALDATSQEIIWTAGPLLVAATASAISPAAAIFMTAAIGLAGNVWFASSRLCARDLDAGERVGAVGSPLVILPIRVLLGTIILTGLMVGAIEVGLPALAIRLDHPGVSGILIGVWSVGSMAGGLAYGSRSWTTSLTKRYVILLAAIAGTSALLVMASSVSLALLFSFLAGVGLAPVFSSQSSLINALAPTGTVTTAFTWATGALVMGIAAGSTLAGALAHSQGVATPFLEAAIAAIAATAGSIILLSAFPTS